MNNPSPKTCGNCRNGMQCMSHWPGGVHRDGVWCRPGGVWRGWYAEPCDLHLPRVMYVFHGLLPEEPEQ